MTTPHGDYDIYLDEKFAPLELIDIAAGVVPTGDA